jgi:hypothetical protein
MKLICKLIGHKMVRESQSSSKERIVKDDFDIHTSLFTVYICSRCNYIFTNTVNFGMPENKE